MIDEDLFNKLPIDKKFEISENSVREDYIFSEMCDMIDEIKPTLEIEAEKRRKAGAKLAPGKEKFKVRDILASCLKVSHGQVEKIEDIKKAVKENPEEFGYIPERIDKGMSIEYAHTMITTTQKAKTPTPNLPKNKFELIYLDLPWNYQLQLEGSPKYKTMTLEEIKKEFPQLPLTDNSVVFMWVTNQKIDEAIDLIRYWSLTCTTNIVWVKTKKKVEGLPLEKVLHPGNGFNIRGSHELLFICKKGNPGIPPVSARIPSVVFAPKTRRHSEKPKIFYEIIEKMYPAKKKLEMFSIVTKATKRKGWTYWGDKLDENSKN